MKLRPVAAPQTAVLGVADHNGWAICVTLAAVGGFPAVVDRRRIELVEPGVPTQPYHHETLAMALPEAEKLVLRVRESVARTTLARVSELREELLPSCAIVAMALRVPPLDYVPKTVAEAHASYTVMCRADGLMYHDALCTAARSLRLAVELHDRGEEIAMAARRLGVPGEELEQFLDTAGETLGPPWRREHRLAAAAALARLVDRVPLSLRA